MPDPALNLFDAENAPVGVPDRIPANTLIQFRRLDLDAYKGGLYALEWTAAGWMLAGAEAAEGWLFSGISQSWSRDRWAEWRLTAKRLADSACVEIDAGRTLLEGAQGQSSHVETMIDKIEAALEGRADSDVSSYSIAGRSLSKMSAAELTEWRDYYYENLMRGQR